MLYIVTYPRYIRIYIQSLLENLEILIKFCFYLQAGVSYGEHVSSDGTLSPLSSTTYVGIVRYLKSRNFDSRNKTIIYMDFE